MVLDEAVGAGVQGAPLQARLNLTYLSGPKIERVNLATRPQLLEPRTLDAHHARGEVDVFATKRHELAVAQKNELLQTDHFLQVM